MKKKTLKEWEDRQKVNPNGITGQRLQEMGYTPKQIRQMTYKDADPIAYPVPETADLTPQPTYKVCAFCLRKFIPDEDSERILFDGHIICPECRREAFRGISRTKNVDR